MQSEARGRAERPDDAATPPDAEPPSPTVAERLRPAGMFFAGVDTGVVSGSLGPPWHAGTLPTSMLRDVLERWRTFLKTSGKGYRRELAPA